LIALVRPAASASVAWHHRCMPRTLSVLARPPVISPLRFFSNGDHDGCRNVHSCLSSAMLSCRLGPRCSHDSACCFLPRRPCALREIRIRPICIERVESRSPDAYQSLLFSSSTLVFNNDRQTHAPNPTVVGTHARSEIFVTCDHLLFFLSPLRLSHHPGFRPNW